MSKIDIAKYPFLIPDEDDTLEDNLMFFWIECWDWRDTILSALFDEIKEILAEDDHILFKVVQVKEKRWWLNINYYGGSDRIYNLIQSVEQLSYHICDRCSLPGRLRDDLSRNETLCDKCYAITTQVWKDIIWYEWLYQVSNIWNVRSLHKWKEIIIKPRMCNWYYNINLYKEWVVVNRYVHRIVATAFISNPENKPQVNHIDWNRWKNCVENLERVTCSENEIHKWRVLKGNNYLQTNHPMKWKFWKENIHSKTVLQYTLDWIFIKERGSTMEVQRELWIDNSNISCCCLWKTKSSWWYKWKYK